MKTKVLLLVRSSGTVMLGAAALLTSVVLWTLIGEARDIDDSAQCRANLSAQVAEIRAEIDAVGWVALLKSATDDLTPEEREETINTMQRLVDQLGVAQKRLDKQFEVCA